MGPVDRLAYIIDEALECYELYGARECMEVYRRAGVREAVEFLEKTRLCEERCDCPDESVEAEGATPEWREWCRRNCVCLDY